MQSVAWNQLATSLDACVAVKNFALSLQVQRIDGNVLYLEHRDPATRSQAEKLCDAISLHIGGPVTVVIQHGPHRARHRCYSKIGEA